MLQKQNVKNILRQYSNMDETFKKNDVVNITFPSCNYLGIILRELKFGLVKVYVPGYGWADISSSRCSHATTKERKEYFKEVLTYG